MKLSAVRTNLAKPVRKPLQSEIPAMYPKGNLFIPASHGQLEAILKEPAGVPRGVGLVCHPHPLGGGTMHNKVVFRTAAGLVDAGLTTLRFNFRGVGASTGEHSEIPGGKEDVRDALHYLVETYASQPVTLAGFSFGSRVGMEVGMNDDRVVRLISIGTPVDKYADYDFLTGLRKPILFVHGDHDEFGSIDSLKRLVDRVSQNTETELVVFPNCGHFFDEHLNELRDAVRDWTIRSVGEKVV
ncbi:MAG: alpha/beta hydrolase [Pyrinomonadaceae bacterium]